MIRQTVLAVLVLLCAQGAFAQSPTLESIERELQRLSKEVETLKVENAALKEQQRLQSSSEGNAGRSLPDRLTVLEQKLTPKVVWSGDLRYRHEEVDAEESTDRQERERIRARLGVTAKVNETVTGVFQIASNSGNNDPRSTTQTLTNGFARKGVAIDLAYVDMQLGNGWSTQLGKMPMPWRRTGSYVWDTDLTPEGAAIKYTAHGFFATTFSYWLNEFSTAADTTLFGGQVGFKGEVRGVGLTAAVGYFDFGSVQDQVTATPTGCARPLNTAFFGGAQGNTTMTLAGCPLLAKDFDMVHVIGQVDLRIGTLPLTLFTDLVQNRAADDLDMGYALGLTLGKAADPYTWEFGLVYQDIEADAAFGQFVDSDFGGGVTDSNGIAIRGAFALSKNYLLSGTYFLNDRFVDVGRQRDYTRVQVEVTAKF